RRGDDDPRRAPARGARAAPAHGRGRGRPRARRVAPRLPPPAPLLDLLEDLGVGDVGVDLAAERALGLGRRGGGAVERAVDEVGRQPHGAAGEQLGAAQRAGLLEADGPVLPASGIFDMRVRGRAHASGGVSPSPGVPGDLPVRREPVVRAPEEVGDSAAPGDGAASASLARRRPKRSSKKSSRPTFSITSPTLWPTSRRAWPTVSNVASSAKAALSWVSSRANASRTCS